MGGRRAFGPSHHNRPFETNGLASFEILVSKARLNSGELPLRALVSCPGSAQRFLQVESSETIMGFRFRKSVKLFPGVRLNFSKSGISTSIGVRGATVNFGHGRQSASLGIPGTCISYHTSSRVGTRALAETSDPGIQYLIEHSIPGTGAGSEHQYQSDPEETVYRLAALLAALVVGGADRTKVEMRIAGLLPERMPGGLGSPLIARTLVWYASGGDGHSSQGTDGIRRAIDKLGFKQTALLASAVSAVRNSLRIQASQGIKLSEPLEWYREDAKVVCREYEAPSLRARIPSDELEEFHRRQLALGEVRMQDVALNAMPRRGPKLLPVFLILAVFAGLMLIATRPVQRRDDFAAKMAATIPASHPAPNNDGWKATVTTISGR